MAAAPISTGEPGQLAAGVQVRLGHGTFPSWREKASVMTLVLNDPLAREGRSRIWKFCFLPIIHIKSHTVCFKWQTSLLPFLFVILFFCQEKGYVCS